MKNRVVIALFLSSMFVYLVCCSQEKKKSSYYSLEIHSKRAWVEVADSIEKHSQGLMYRHSLPPNTGMLFLYSKPKILSFWMKNTFIPLSIAFIRSDGTISEILAMAPDDGRPDYLLPRYQSKEKVQYALEMPRNWFKKNGIHKGMKVKFPPGLLKKVVHD